MTNRVPKRDHPTPPTRSLPPMAEYHDEVSETVLKKLAAVSEEHGDDEFEIVEGPAWHCSDVRK